MNRNKEKRAAGASQTDEYEDGRSYNRQAVRQITQKWVEHHMDKREAEFTTKANGTIFVGTWNVNAKKQDETLHDWLIPDGIEAMADLYAIGFQEIVDLNAMNVALDSSKTLQRSQFWQEKIEECLCTKESKESIATHVKDVRCTTQATGLMGMMGNKGGVCVRLSMYDTSICFVCSHLAAHRENVVGRNADFHTICKGAVFAKPGGETTAATTGEEVATSEVVNRPIRGAELNLTRELELLTHHEYIFWLGDLNYRIDDSLSTDEVFKVIERKELALLREKDQLNIERAKGNAFEDFEEGILEFVPTYKYQPGTDDYDTRPEKKIRAPAWCDRVLWRNTLSGYSIALKSYQRANLKPSDHKPVYARFHCEYRVLIEEKERNVYNEIMKSLEYWKNDAVPQVETGEEILDMGLVKFQIPVHKTFTIKNTSSAIAYWRFVRKVEDAEVCKRWLSLDVTQGLLLPNETATIIVTICVDVTTSQAVNAGHERLDDVLVLRLEGGYDHYLPVTAEYSRSCVGMSLEALAFAHVPVRSLPMPGYVPRVQLLTDNGYQYEQRLMEYAQQQAAAKDAPLSIPKEIWRLVDALWSGNALREKDLFAVEGDPDEMFQIREALDCGEEFTAQCSPHSYADVLQALIAGFPTPLLPYDLYPTSEVDNQQMRMWARKFLDALLPLNYNVFVYVMSFFREVLQQREYNRSSVERLVEVCVKIMTSIGTVHSFLSNEEVTKRKQRQVNMQGVFVYFLTTNAL